MLKKISKKAIHLVIDIILTISTVAIFACLFESYLYTYKGSSVVKLTKTYNGKRGGTGFQVKAPSGKQYTLTNAHICAAGNKLIAHTQYGKKVEVKVIEIYKKHDLCIMDPVKEVRPLKIA